MRNFLRIFFRERGLILRILQHVGSNDQFNFFTIYGVLAAGILRMYRVIRGCKENRPAGELEKHEARCVSLKSIRASARPE